MVTLKEPGNNIYKYLYYITFFVSMISVLINITMYKYLNDLENNADCKCSNNKRIALLKKLIILTVLMIIFSKVAKYILKNNILIRIILFISIILFIYSFYTFFKYNSFLYENNCICSDNIRKITYKYYLYIFLWIFCKKLHWLSVPLLRM